MRCSVFHNIDACRFIQINVVDARSPSLSGYVSDSLCLTLDAMQWQNRDFFLRRVGDEYVEIPGVTHKTLPFYCSVFPLKTLVYTVYLFRPGMLR